MNSEKRKKVNNITVTFNTIINGHIYVLDSTHTHIHTKETSETGREKAFEEIISKFPNLLKNTNFHIQKS